MAFTIPDETEAAFPVQARLYQTDLDALVAGQGGTGVISGCAVTAQGSPNMTLAVAAGEVSSAGIAATVTSGNVTVTTADGSLDRLDLVVASSSGTKSVEAGTAAATASVLPPPCPAGSVVLAQVYVPATDTAIGSTQLVDKRVMVLPAASGGAADTNGTVSSGYLSGGVYFANDAGVAWNGSYGQPQGNQAADTIHYVPVKFPHDGTLTDLGIHVQGYSASVGFRMGLWANDNSGTVDVPGALLQDFGGGTITSTGHKFVTSSEAITAGVLYWVGLNVDAAWNGSGTFWFAPTAGKPHHVTPSYGSMRKQAHTLGALPNPAASTADAGWVLPLVLFKATP